VCEDCSTSIFDVIVCTICAEHCHKGHNVSLTVKNKVHCRCMHKKPRKQDAPKNLEVENELNVDSFSKSLVTDNDQIDCAQLGGITQVKSSKNEM
jgi:hypothetical protein